MGMVTCLRISATGRCGARTAAAAATLSLTFVSSAFAETTVQTGKSDREMIVVGSARSDALQRADAPRQADAAQLSAAFDLFESTRPSRLGSSVVPLLRTASLDRASLGSIEPVASAPNATGLPASLGETQAVKSALSFPLPTPKPAASERVRVASIAPMDDTPSSSKPSAINAAPILGEPRKMPSGAGPYVEIFRREAKVHNIPLWLALGVGWVESKFDPKLRGTHTVVGMMQVMPSTAREMGYKGSTNQLFNPETNIVWGMKELAKDYQLAHGDPCMAIAKYKGGFRTNHINGGAARYCAQAKLVTGMN